MPKLEGTKTHVNLKEAFAGESQANRRYLYFARRADIEGLTDAAALFRDTAEGETGHAFGHFDFLAEVGDPATGEPVGTSEKHPATGKHPDRGNTGNGERPGTGTNVERPNERDHRCR
jgi:rubrerythrin